MPASSSARKTPICAQQREAQDPGRGVGDQQAGAQAERRQPGTFRMQQGYDHSYFFVQTFMADHIRWHAERLG